MSKYIYTTLLATDDYIWGVLGLYFSLQNVQSKYEFVPIVTDGVSADTITMLDNLNISYKIFPQYDFLDRNSNYQATFNKFHIFQLTEYEKVCFLDGDAVVTSNMDDIFTQPTPAFMVLSNTFISGVMILVDPRSQDFNFLLKLRSIFGEDESIWNRLYSPAKVTNIEEYEHRIIHRSDGGSKQHKYWKFFNLDTVDKLKDFMLLESTREFVGLRCWMITGNAACSFDLNKIPLVH